MKTVLPFVDYTRDWVRSESLKFGGLIYTSAGRGDQWLMVLHVGYLFYDYVEQVYAFKNLFPVLL